MISENGEFSISEKRVKLFTAIVYCLSFFLYSRPFSLRSGQRLTNKRDWLLDTINNLK